MNTQKDVNAKEGMRVKLINMIDDPNPISSGTEGTISLIDHAGIIHVDWDNGRRLGLIPGIDKYVLMNEESFNSAVKSIPNNVKKFMPNLNIKKSNGRKTEVSKNFESVEKVEKKVKQKKVKSKKDKKIKTEMTGTAGGLSTGAYTTKLENKTISKKVVKEITNSKDFSSFDDTRFEAWSDKNRDGWKWNDKPAFHKEGEIVDPLAKISATWDDDNLDISKEWDGVQNKKLKKEDVIRMVNNRLNESKEDKVHTKKWDRCVKNLKEKGDVDSPEAVCTKTLGYEGSVKKSHRKEEKTELEETTTFGSVWGSNGPPVGPTFAAKQGQWRTGKKPIWKGGKIVQKIENSGVLNPVKESEDKLIPESNKTKFTVNGDFVKIKKKCTKFPYCSQGAVDKPLKLSKNTDEIGSYVEESEMMKKIHEVSKITGKPFQEIYNIVKKNIKK